MTRISTTIPSPFFPLLSLPRARYFECFENDCDLVLHCRHAHIEGGGNDLVAFSLHQERKHLDLSIGQPETAQNFACRQSVCKPRRRRFLTVENFRGNVNTAGEH